MSDIHFLSIFLVGVYRTKQELFSWFGYYRLSSDIKWGLTLTMNTLNKTYLEHPLVSFKYLKLCPLKSMFEGAVIQGRN